MSCFFFSLEFLQTKFLDGTFDANIEIAAPAFEAIHVLRGVIAHAAGFATFIGVGHVTLPCRARVGRQWVRCQLTLVHINLQPTVLDDRWLASLQGANPTKMVLALIIILFARVEHIVHVEVIPGATVAHNVFGAIVADELADQALLHLQLVASWAANIDAVVVDAELHVYLGFFSDLLLQSFLEQFNTVVSSEALRVLDIWSEKLLAVFAILFVHGTEFLMLLKFKAVKLCATAFFAELCQELAFFEMC